LIIRTVDNFNSDYGEIKEYKKINICNGYICEIPKGYTQALNITFEKYRQNKNELFQLSDKTPDKDDLILSLSHYKNNNETIYNVNVGNYIGKFKYNNTNIDIKSRFSDTFLKRMLNFVNDVYLDDVDISGKIKNDKDLNYSKFIIYYMFIQKLEKAFLLGLPKAYKTIHHHDMTLKGKIDINKFIKYDIPFKGKISSSSREQREIQEIIDVLYRAISIIEKNKFNTKNISNIKTHLKQYRSNRYVSNETISKAIKSKALQNPIFAPYKKVLEYAKLIINANNLEEKKDADKKTFGFLVNVAELFEIYLVKLLQLRMPDWEVIHEEQLDVYKDNFFRRNMYPDIIMKKDNKVMVFDAKYKRMKFRGKDNNGAGDLDRSDFFQINTYMTYYDKKGYEIIAGGLLYPIEKEFDCRFCDEIDCKEDYSKFKVHSNDWFGDTKTKFIVDGIDLSYIENNIEKDMTEEEKLRIRMSNILNAENNFIDRIKKISENTNDPK